MEFSKKGLRPTIKLCTAYCISVYYETDKNKHHMESDGEFMPERVYTDLEKKGIRVNHR